MDRSLPIARAADAAAIRRSFARLTDSTPAARIGVKRAHAALRSARPIIQLPVARGELALIQTNLVAHFPAEELTALLAKATGEMNLVTGTNELRERRHISIDDWQHDVG